MKKYKTFNFYLTFISFRVSNPFHTPQLPTYSERTAQAKELKKKKKKLLIPWLSLGTQVLKHSLTDIH